MKDKARSLLAIEPGDGAPLRLLGLTFAVSAAASIVIATVTKSLFLSANPLERLPWVLLGSGLFTAVTAILYVQAMQRFDLRRRFTALLGVAVVSFVGLRLLFPIDREMMSLVIFVWAPGMGHLIIVQTWNMASTMLPTRQVKRLIPVLAGMATVGAAVGGAATRLVLEVEVVGAEDLMLMAALLLCWPLFRVHRSQGPRLLPLRRRRLRLPASSSGSSPHTCMLAPVSVCTQYGTMRENVLSLTAVLADGTIVKTGGLCSWR